MIEDIKLTEEEYVVFDLETTGLYPNSGDTIIEIGAVKIKNGKIIDRYDELINPFKDLSEEEIQKLTYQLTDVNYKLDSLYNIKHELKNEVFVFPNSVSESAQLLKDNLQCVTF